MYLCWPEVWDDDDDNDVDADVDVPAIFFSNARQVAHVALPFRAGYFEVFFSGTNHHMDLLF